VESKRLGFAVLHHMLSLSVFTAGHFRLALCLKDKKQYAETTKVVSQWWPPETDDGRPSLCFG